ncbi:hypothetical protein J6590_057547 [Homalodisca vitripennis]|nr:hypothetical protein J6590_057547 [Homalodisca vitripennis]
MVRVFLSPVTEWQHIPSTVKGILMNFSMPVGLSFMERKSSRTIEFWSDCLTPLMKPTSDDIPIVFSRVEKLEVPIMDQLHRSIPVETGENKTIKAKRREWINNLIRSKLSLYLPPDRVQHTDSSTGRIQPTIKPQQPPHVELMLLCDSPTIIRQNRSIMSLCVSPRPPCLLRQFLLSTDKTAASCRCVYHHGHRVYCGNVSGRPPHVELLLLCDSPTIIRQNRSIMSLCVSPRPPCLLRQCERQTTARRTVASV